jgi:plasmid stabilization system protein ParE
MTRRLQIFPLAATDIDDQKEYLAVHASEKVANRFQEMLRKTFAWIEECPEAGAPWESNHPLLEGIRYRMVDRFRRKALPEVKHLPWEVAFYRVRIDSIDVIRVLHTSQDLEKILLEFND